MDIQQIKIIERRVKYPRLELKTGQPILIVPEGIKHGDMIVKKHERWLKEKISFVKKIQNKYKNRKIYERSNEELIKLVIKLVNRFSKTLGVRPRRVGFRLMKTKWGSCSKKGRLCFNLMLKNLPPSLISYVVFHEMLHLIIPNHQKEFWHKMKGKFKNLQLYEERLYGYWFLLNRAK